ncbi:hypothetical protein [Mucilaginibacter sp. NFX135]|uniref:hypothetical protein n=1 Tax=Mucilaginibacter sp. NFX135 TaxID=3402687 RepID=UPI003AFA5E97
MTIKYLIQLNNYPSIIGFAITKTLEPISMEEIISLENSYNNRHPFPIALRELLFLAGKYCYVLDYGLTESQQEMQEWARRGLTKYNRNLSISRPFFVIDIYNANDQFVFVYLDDGENPMVYEALLFELKPDEGPWIHSLGKRLSEYIDSGIAKLLKGINPF